MRVPLDSEEAVLVCRARHGDRSAFDLLVAHYRAPLLGMAFVRTGHRDEADDLVQEIFARAWLKLPTLQQDTAFTPWLKTLAANACNSWHRKARPAVCPLDEDSVSGHSIDCFASSPVEVVLQREADRALREALALLPPANCMALLMLVWGGHSYQEIARFTGVEPKTVEGRIRRAKLRLRRVLRDEYSAFFRDPAEDDEPEVGKE